jgi:hypothetical protein
MEIGAIRMKMVRLKYSAKIELLHKIELMEFHLLLNNNKFRPLMFNKIIAEFVRDEMKRHLLMILIKHLRIFQQVQFSFISVMKNLKVNLCMKINKIVTYTRSKE